MFLRQGNGQEPGGDVFTRRTTFEEPLHHLDITCHTSTDQGSGSKRDTCVFIEHFSEALEKFGEFASLLL